MKSPFLLVKPTCNRRCKRPQVGVSTVMAPTVARRFKTALEVVETSERRGSTVVGRNVMDVMAMGYGGNPVDRW